MDGGAAPDPRSARPAVPHAAVELVATWREAGPKLWFARDAGFDRMLRERFETLHLAAARGECCGWIDTPPGALALVLLLDQIPRNIWRGSAHAFATDVLARTAAEGALARGHDTAVDPSLRPFFYMPFEHAEDATLQARAVDLFEHWAAEHGDPRGFSPYARIHRDVIARFGRFPQRNAALGRETTEAERAFLEAGGFAGLRDRRGTGEPDASQDQRGRTRNGEPPSRPRPPPS